MERNVTTAMLEVVKCPDFALRLITLGLGLETDSL